MKYDLDNSVGIWISWTARVVERELARELAQHEITPQQWVVLVMLMENGPTHQAALSDLMQSEQAALGRMLDDMERDGWVARVPDPGDRRRKRVEMQRKAEKRWNAIANSCYAVRARATRGIPEEDLRALRDLLRRLRRNLDPELEATVLERRSRVRSNRAKFR